MRSNLIPKFIFAILMMTGASSCSPLRSADAQSNPPKWVVEPVTDIGVDTGASYFTEVSFEKGKSTLDAKELKSIGDLVDRSARSGEMRNVKILGFSDQAYSAEPQGDFFKHQKRLADARNESIKKYLETNYPQVQVEVYNMVTKPTVVEELVQKSDANLRKTFEDAGMMVGNNLNSCAPKIVSKAVVVSIIKKTKD